MTKEYFIVPIGGNRWLQLAWVGDIVCCIEKDFHQYSLNPCTILLYILHFRSFSSILTYVRRHKLCKFIAGILVFVLLFRLAKPNYFSYAISYAKIIYDLVNTDMQRQNDVIKQNAQVFALFKSLD